MEQKHCHGHKECVKKKCTKQHCNQMTLIACEYYQQYLLIDFVIHV